MKQLPQNIPYEQSILSGVLLDSEMCTQAAEALDPEDFYSTANKLSFAACKELHSNGEPVGLVSVCNLLKEKGQLQKVNAAYLSQLLGSHPIPSSVPHYAKDIKTKAKARKTIQVMNEVMNACFSSNGDAAKAIAEAKQAIIDIDLDDNKSIAGSIVKSTDFVSLELPAKRIILDPWLTEQSLTLISGWRGTGKTWFALSLLDAISKRLAFGPWETETPVKTLYLEGEMASQDVQQRAKELDMGVGAEHVYIYSDSYASSLGIPRANLLCEKWQQSIKQYMIDKNIKLWVCDNIASLASGLDENSAEAWGPVNTWLLGLRFAGISTILLHHTGKSGEQRGTSHREDNLDNSIILKQPENYEITDGCRFIAEFKKNRVVSKDQFMLTELEFTYSDGKWSYATVKGKNQNEVMKLLDEGHTQSEVSDSLGISKGQVSKIRKKAVKKGWLTEKNTLTPSGCQQISGGNF